MKSAKLILSGNYQAAVLAAENEIPRDRGDDLGIGSVLNLGIALICVGDLQKASQHFGNLRRTYKKAVSTHYVYSGLVNWLLGHKETAIQLWKDSGHCTYTFDDGFESPFSLYFGNVLDHDAVAKRDILQALEKLCNLRNEHWPTPIARMILNKATRQQVLEQAVVTTGKNKQARTNRRVAQTHFYSAILDLECGNESGWNANLHACSATKRVNQLFHELVFARSISTLVKTVRV